MTPAVSPRPALAVVDDAWLRPAPADDGLEGVDAWASAFRSRGGLRPEPVLELQPGAASRHATRMPEARMARPGFARINPLQPIPGIDSDGRGRRLAEFAVGPQPSCCERGYGGWGTARRGDARRGDAEKERRGDIPVSPSRRVPASARRRVAASPRLSCSVAGLRRFPAPFMDVLLVVRGSGTLTVWQPWASDFFAPMGIS